MLDPKQYRTIQIDKRDTGIAVATLNRPERLNAVNGEMHRELTTLWVDADADDDVRALVVTGAGRAFCSGGDFGADGIETQGRGLKTTMREGRLIVENLLDCSKPVIGAIHGYAMGLGATIALLCDVVVADRGTTFADTHVRMGVGAGDGGQVIWPLLVGVNRAKYLLMTGDRVTGEEAERLGLVNFLVDEGDALERALEIAGRLAAGPTQAITASKVPINRYIKMIANLVLPLSLEMEAANMRSDDAREAAAAFREKREPRFKGS
jgi:enoyl-CoA hydratase